MNNNTITVDFAELEALHDVLEAARCYWHQHQPTERAANALRSANRLFWMIGEQLPKTGEPSERFLPVSMHDDSPVSKLLNCADSVRRDHDNANDPWWADTIVAAPNFATMASPEEWQTLVRHLKRLGLTLELDSSSGPNQMTACRKDLGPWPEQSD